MPFRRLTRVGPANNVLDGGVSHWRHLANTTERFMRASMRCGFTSVYSVHLFRFTVRRAAVLGVSSAAQSQRGGTSLVQRRTLRRCLATVTKHTCAFMKINGILFQCDRRRAGVLQPLVRLYRVMLTVKFIRIGDMVPAVSD